MTIIDLIAIFLALLFVKHFIADFVIQYDYMVEQKGIYGAIGGIHHALIHVAGTWLILIWILKPIEAFTIAAADGIIHYHIDWLKMNINRWRNLTVQDHEFWFWLGADQLIHSLTYIGIIWYIL